MDSISNIDAGQGKAIILVGGGGHCRSVIDVLETAGWDVAGIVQGPEASASPVLGYPVLGRDGDLSDLRKWCEFALVTVGQIKNPEPRRRLHALLLRLGFTLPPIASPFARVSRHARVGAGTIIMHQAMVNAGAIIGDNVIVNSQTLVEHDCRIGDNCHLAVGVTLSGDVTVGHDSFVGAGTVVRNGVRIGAGCIVGMGGKVLGDIPDGSVYLG